VLHEGFLPSLEGKLYSILQFQNNTYIQISRS
jgi:hypothetical protein